jgi:DNA-binding NtrC family response regulator
VAPSPSAGSQSASPAARSVGYHGAVHEFKRRLIEATLHQVKGNRTHAARALGLQRTYLLRLMRELAVTAPPAPVRRSAASRPG